MKNFCFLLLAFILFFSSGYGMKKIAPPVDKRMKVAVVEFDSKGNVAIKDSGKILAEWIQDALVKTSRLNMVERILLNKVMEEQKLTLSGVIDEETAAQIGKIFGVAGIVTGSIIEWQGVYSLTARLIDTKTGKVLASATLPAESAKDIPSKIEGLAATLVRDLPNEEGKVPVTLPNLEEKAGDKKIASIIKTVETEGGKISVAINKGTRDGVAKGDLYEIIAPVYELSPITGKRIKMGSARIGIIKIEYLEERQSMGKFILTEADKDSLLACDHEGIAIYRGYKENPLYLDVSLENISLPWNYSSPLIGASIGLNYFWNDNNFFWVGLKLGGFLPMNRNTLASYHNEPLFIAAELGVYPLGSLATEWRMSVTASFYMTPLYLPDSFSNSFVLDRYNYLFIIPVTLGVEWRGFRLSLGSGLAVYEKYRFDSTAAVFTTAGAIFDLRADYVF